MAKLVDCFLFNDEVELLDIRLRLLADVVERFTIVWAEQTFTGRRKETAFPWQLESLVALGERVQVIQLDRIEGDTAWEKEWFSRNALSRGWHGLGPEDLVMISDVDEIPRPSVLQALKNEPPNGPRVLVQDYFNFKFNYQLIVGLQAAWAGPVLCPMSNMSTPQALRDMRWAVLHDADRTLHDAGWHFSFLTAGDDVALKLASFSHQEPEVQARTQRVSDLIAARTGFHDHMHAGGVWVIVDPGSLRCDALVRLIGQYPKFMADGPADGAEETSSRVKLAVNRIYAEERRKLLQRCSSRELAAELWRRAKWRAVNSLAAARRPHSNIKDKS